MFAQLRTGLRILTEIFRQSYGISPTYRLRELIMKLNNNNHVSKCSLHNFCGNPTPLSDPNNFITVPLVTRERSRRRFRFEALRVA